MSQAYRYEVLERLTRLNTVSTMSNVPAAEYLADQLDDQGFKCALHQIEIDGMRQANLVAWSGPPEPDGLIISGHIDTVPFEGQPGWARDPLNLEVADERIYGRGVADMKGFLAQSVEVARVLDQSRLRRPLVFLFTANEEIGGEGAKRVAPELPHLLGDLPTPRLAWIGEPSSNRVIRAQKSIATLSITVSGRGGHSGLPEQGVNAIAVMGKVINALGGLQAKRRLERDAELAALFPDAPYDVMNFGVISGGLAHNMIAEECTLKVSYRSLPNADPMKLYNEIAQLIEEIDPHDYGSPEHRAMIRISAPLVLPPMIAPAGTSLEKALFAATGATVTEGALYWTDGGWFALEGIETLICGPGEFDQAHQPNESIPRDAFDAGPALILDVIDRLCGRSN
ncbi:MAG TPA: M20 family metallopeptidase [Candidatus Binataceae bacterium]|nr:M20 family metallopeptidase [Candidatus Binataceae bacterium]